jgi:hypothetical protein
MSNEHRNYLIKGLVGDHLQLYRTNSIFKLTIDTLADMLPIWIEGLAQHSIKQYEQIQQRMPVVQLNMTPDKTELLKQLGFQHLVNMDEPKED